MDTVGPLPWASGSAGSLSFLLLEESPSWFPAQQVWERLSGLVPCPLWTQGQHQGHVAGDRGGFTPVG